MALKKLTTEVSALIDSSSHICCFVDVVKELVYNALDSDASSIAVRINLQKKQIQVVDNGCGVTKTDMKYIGEKNYTSKCYNMSNVKSELTKYGFRGKSLSNIINVSEVVRIISRHKTTADTYSKLFNNKKLSNILKVDKRPSQGTTVEVHGSFYNLMFQSKLYNSMQEIQDVKLFLEHIVLMHHDISISLRDDIKNEIILSFHKKRDIFQTIELIFAVPKSNLQELHIEKNYYKVIAYIEKNHCSKNQFQLIYLNGRFLHNCKLHRIVKDNLIKVLGLRINNSKKARDTNICEGLMIDNINLPSYILLFTCPYDEYDLKEFCKLSVLEFCDWGIVHNILKKLMKFYIGDVSLKEIALPQNIKQKTQDTRDQVKEIMDRLFDRNKKICGISQLHNAIQGKPVKRKKKMDYTLSTNFIDIKDRPVQDEKNSVKQKHNFLSREDNLNIESKAVQVKKKCNYVTDGINISMRRMIFNEDNEACMKPNNMKNDLRKVFENPSDSVKKRAKALADRIEKLFKLKQTMSNLKETQRCEAKNLFDKKLSMKKKFCKISKICSNHRSANHFKNVTNKHLVISSYDLIKTVVNCENINHFSYEYQNVRKNRHSNNMMFKKSKGNYNASFNVLTYKSHNEYCSNNFKHNSLRQDNVMDSQNHKINFNSPSCDIIQSQKTIVTRCEGICKNFRYLNEDKENGKNMKKYLNSNKNMQEPVPCIDECNITLMTTPQKKRRLEVNKNCRAKTSNKQKVHNYLQNAVFDANTIRNTMEVFDNNAFSGKKIIEQNDIRKSFHKSINMYKAMNDSCYFKTEIMQNNLEQSFQFSFPNNFKFQNNKRWQHVSKESNNEIYNTIFSEKQENNIMKNNLKTKNDTKLVDTSENLQNLNVVFISKSLPHSESSHTNDAKICDLRHTHETVMEAFDFNSDIFSQNYTSNIANSHSCKDIFTQLDHKEQGLYDEQVLNSEKDLSMDQYCFEDSYEKNKRNGTKDLENKGDGNDNFFEVGPIEQKNVSNYVVPLENDNLVFLTKVKKENKEMAANFDFKSRLNFIPKGMSPIFEKYGKNFTDISLDMSCFNNRFYNDFLNNIERDSKVYEGMIQDQNTYANKSFQKVYAKKLRDKMAIVFDALSLKSAKVLQQIDGKFICAKIYGRNIVSNVYSEHLALFDQHAVHERIKLEAILSEYVQNDRWQRAAVDAIVLNLSKEENLYLSNHKEKFMKYGLEWEFVDDGYISVFAIPQAIIGKTHREAEIVIKAVKSLIAELVHEMKIKKGSPFMYPKSIMDLVYSESCKFAIKFGEILPQNKCVELVQELSNCKTPFQCAHGRPTLAVLLELKENNHCYRINLKKLKYLKARN